MTFPETLRLCRRLHGFTQTELGAVLGVDKQTVSNWETGRTRPFPTLKTRVLSRLADLTQPARQKRRILDRIMDHG